MPKLTAPLLSMGAKGQIGKTMVMSTWKGVPYARQYVTPANPRTTKQTANRGIWAFLNAAYLYAPTQVKAAFDAFSVGKPLTGRNKFFQDNQKLLAVQPTPTEITNFIFSPGNGGGLPPVGLVITPGNSQLVLTTTIPIIPDGWTLNAVIGVAIEQTDPSSAFDGRWYVAEDAVAPYEVTLTGLANGQEYVVGLFLKWTKPDGKEAYSVSLMGTGTPAL